MRKNRGQTLVASLIVIVIICILAATFLVGPSAFGGKQSARPDGKGQTLIGQSMYAAKDDVCRNQLGQLRQSIMINTTTDEEYPASLEGTRLGSNFYQCPVGKEPYDYDPATGKVACKHAGHEKY